MIFERLKKEIYNTKYYILYDRYKTQKLRSEIEDLGLKSSLEFKWSNYKKSDTLYILGSGLSVMDLTQNDWNEVKKHDSFGFNGWVFHDFIPTYYGIEPMANNNVFNWYIRALRQKQEVFQNMPIFIQYQHMKMRGKHFDYEGIDQNNIYYHVPYMPNTTNERVLKRCVQRFVRQSHLDFSEVFHYSGSLSYVLNMGYVMGYKKMILLGVDLNTSEYYYSHGEAGELAKDFNQFQVDRPNKEKWDLKATHNTMSKRVTESYGCLPISTYIGYFKEAIQDRNIELLIGSNKSALYPMLELYQFP